MKRRRSNSYLQTACLLALGLLVQTAWAADTTVSDATDSPATVAAETVRGTLKIGDSCNETSQCGYDGATCDGLKSVCGCLPELGATNHVDMCGKVALFNETCSFAEQCELGTHLTECRDGRCKCRTNMTHTADPEKEGTFKCILRGALKIGDPCNATHQCGYDGAVCEGSRPQCGCQAGLGATNHLDKCGKVAIVNETCFFNEQCEEGTPMTECRDSRCTCLFEMSAMTEKDGTIKCAAKIREPKSERYVDPAMIGVLVGMALMFIILCVVLRLFSKARWRENRTIFNTPNPRLMNVSLLRDSKLLHSGAERRGSRASVRGPSRQPSMASLRPTSPSHSIGSRRGSRGSSNASATSTKSPKSPTKLTANNTAAPVLENVTVEVQDPKV